MTVYECKCGFTSGTAVGFTKHLERREGTGEEHGVLSPIASRTRARAASGAAAPLGSGQPTSSRLATASNEAHEPKADNAGAEGVLRAGSLQQGRRSNSNNSGGLASDGAGEAAVPRAGAGADVPAHPPDRSWFSSLWAPSPGKRASRDGGVATGEGTAEQEGAAAGAGVLLAERAASGGSADTSGSRPSVEEFLLPDSAKASDASGQAEAAWEAVGALVGQEGEGEGDYSALTRQLEDTGGAEAAPGEGAGGGVTGALAKACYAMRDAAVAVHSIGWRRSLDGSDRAGTASGAPRGAHGDAALATRRSDGPASAGGSVAVADLEAVMLWRDPWLTTRVFAAGLYLLICARNLVTGVELLQPSTALAGAALAALAVNTVHGGWVRARAARGYTVIQEERSPEEKERDLQVAVAARLEAAARSAAPVVGAVVALVWRRLSGKDRLGATVWLGFLLWLVMWVGELRLVSQSGLALGAWAAAFILPSLYQQCCHALDALVEEALYFFGLVLTGGQRTTLLLAGGVSLFILSALEASIFTRVSLAIAAGSALLVWRARAHRLASAPSSPHAPMLTAG